MKTTETIKSRTVNVRGHVNVALRLGVLVGLLAVLGCNSKPADDTAAQEKQSTPAAAIGNASDDVAKPSGTLSLTPKNTTVAFLGEKVVGSHEGKFNALSGEISYKDGDPLTANVAVNIDMSSVKTDAEKLDEHLKSADFFDAAKFPEGKFVSHKVTDGGEGDATHTVTGNLTLRGVTKQIAIPAKIDVTGNTVSMVADVTINRQDYGIAFPGMPDNLIKDEVKISLKIEGDI